MCATTLIIDASLGGSVYDWLAIARIVECVEIRGVCGSACTAVLGVSQACVGEAARLLFHGVTSASPVREQALGEAMAQDWPDALRSWFLAGPIDLRGADYIGLWGREAAAMGVRLCGGE